MSASPARRTLLGPRGFFPERFGWRDVFRPRSTRRLPGRGGEQVLVIGLGRFGAALALSLVESGHEVLGVDADPVVVQSLRDRLTHVVVADSTDLGTLRQLGAESFDRAVVGVGTDIESSILVTSNLVELGVGVIWAKAVTDAHGKILERVGAHHVVFPEREMGERVSHLVTGRMLDFVEVDRGFALVETPAPPALLGVSLGAAALRSRFGVTVVCVKPAGGSFTYAERSTVLSPGDVLLVAGETRAVEAFAEL